jgi:hypothetical protein
MKRTGGENARHHTLVAATIAQLITTGTTEQELLAAVACRFPDLTPAELSQALQVATAAAERGLMGLRRMWHDRGHR